MYSMYSKYYDRLNGNYDYWIPFIKSHIAEKEKKARMIEYGCGTGNVLEKFKDEYELYGVDISNSMLEQAKTKLPYANFILEDMVFYKSTEKYDIALCLFDSINHVLDFENWKVFFKNVANSLTSTGVFIFDANTTERLSRIVLRPALFSEFDDNYFYMKVKQKTDKNFVFDVRILKRTSNNTFEEEKEEIEETTESGKKIYDALKSSFLNIKIFSEEKEEIDKSIIDQYEKNRLFFICSN